MVSMDTMVKQIKTIKFKKFGKDYELDIDWSGNFLELAVYDQEALDESIDRDSMLQNVNLDTEPIWRDSVDLL